MARLVPTDTISKLEIKLKDRNSIYFYDLFAGTTIDQLIDGVYKDNNGDEYSVNVWDKINNRELFLCNNEWEYPCDSVPSNVRIIEIWNGDRQRRSYITQEGEDGSRKSMKLYAKLKEDDDPDLPFTMGGKKSKKKKPKKKKKNKSKKSKKIKSKKIKSKKLNKSRRRRRNI
jgi:hypothetical protein